MKTIKSLFILAATALLSSVSAMAEKAPEIGGYCPVCYIATSSAVKGSEEFTAEHDGKIYYMAGADALKAFKATPNKFLPQYDGYCAYGVSIGKKLEVDPTVFKVVNGKIYLNKDAEVGKLFAKDTNSHIQKADKQWMVMKKKEMMKK